VEDEINKQLQTELATILCTPCAPSLHAQGEGPAQYFYDDLSRPTRVVDPNGNIARHSYNAVLASRRVLRDADNQLTQFGPSSLTYDANGNLTSDGTNTYTWSARNQLISVSGGVSAIFQYDAFGRRVSKTVTGTTQYLYDGVNPVQELSGASVSANLLTGLGVDEYFERTDANGPANFLTDALGSTVALTGASGNTLASYTYEPFGNTTVSGSSSNSYQFTARENDGTGLYFLRNRYYSFLFERFVSEDSLQFLAGPNFYSYVGGDPVLRTDPLGLCWIYSQTTGNLFYNPDWTIYLYPSTTGLGGDFGGYSLGPLLPIYVGNGHAGNGEGYDNPDYQYVANVGPLPQGLYTIGPIGTHIVTNAQGKQVHLYDSMWLTPNSGNNMGNPPRNGFLIHGGLLSRGCIILPDDVRKEIGNSPDHCLEVVP